MYHLLSKSNPNKTPSPEVQGRGWGGACTEHFLVLLLKNIKILDNLFALPSIQKSPNQAFSFSKAFSCFINRLFRRAALFL